MNLEGPALESLLRRLAETPDDFLLQPRHGNAGRIKVPAIVADLCRTFGYALSMAELSVFEHPGKDARRHENMLRVSSISAWLLFDPWFRAARPTRDAILFALVDNARELAQQTDAALFTTDPDRREELARSALARLGFRPLGESVAQAQDRLTSLSTAERARVLHAAKEAEARARAVRDALIKKAAEESADKSSRE